MNPWGKKSFIQYGMITRCLKWHYLGCFINLYKIPKFINSHFRFHDNFYDILCNFIFIYTTLSRYCVDFVQFVAIFYRGCKSPAPGFYFVCFVCIQYYIKYFYVVYNITIKLFLLCIWLRNQASKLTDIIISYKILAAYCSCNSDYYIIYNIIIIDKTWSVWWRVSFYIFFVKLYNVLLYIFTLLYSMFTVNLGEIKQTKIIPDVLAYIILSYYTCDIYFNFHSSH